MTWRQVKKLKPGTALYVTRDVGVGDGVIPALSDVEFVSCRWISGTYVSTFDPYAAKSREDERHQYLCIHVRTEADPRGWLLRDPDGVELAELEDEPEPEPEDGASRFAVCAAMMCDGASWAAIAERIGVTAGRARDWTTRQIERRWRYGSEALPSMPVQSLPGIDTRLVQKLRTRGVEDVGELNDRIEAGCVRPGFAWRSVRFSLGLTPSEVRNLYSALSRVGIDPLR